MKKVKKLGVVFAFVAPAIIGFIGYWLDGNTAMDAAYGAVQMYLMEAGSINNNLLIEFARWVAPVMMVSGLFLILKTAAAKMRDFFVSFYPDAVALYGDAPTKEIVKNNVRHAICVEGEEIIDAASHILMFTTDEKSLEFYTKHKDVLRGEVLVQLENNDSYTVSLDDVKFFNPHEMIARKFWQENDIRRVLTCNEMKIAIVGSGTLAKKILSLALLNNIYTLGQKIEYHIYSEEDYFEKEHGDFQFANADTVVYHDIHSKDSLFSIATADRVIFAQKADNAFLAELVQLCAGEIFIFDPMDTFVNIFAYEQMYTFGQHKAVLTEENIRTDGLYDFAKALNYRYVQIYLAEGEELPTQEEAWNALDAFTKGSNIASTDYHLIMKIIMQETGKTDADDTLAELEHIRWCRYHYLHHWKYGETENGKKDAKNKIHPCLRPFAELNDIDKQKDADGIRMLLSLSARGGI